MTFLRRIPLAPRTPALLVVAVGAFLLSGWSWAVASPVGSAADDGFHLSTIWCAWGPSDSCAMSPDRQTLVPEAVVGSPCFALTPGIDGRCSEFLTERMVPAATSDGYNPPLFYTLMRTFVGPDVANSVIAMRLGNVLIAVVMLATAYAVSSSGARRALVLGWSAAVVPVGLFFIASTNPSSWVIIGAGTFWALLLAVMSAPVRSVRFLTAAVGALIAVTISLGARPDSVYMLLVSTVIVLILRAHIVKSLFSTAVRSAVSLLFLIVVTLLVLAYVLNTRIRSIIELTLNGANLPTGNAATDQPNALLKMMLEFPSFVASLLGGQVPVWSQRTDALDATLTGYSFPGFTYGLGWTDVALPVTVSLTALGVCLWLIFQVSPARTPRYWIATAFAALGFLLVIVGWRIAWGFGTEGGFLQPRYFFPLFLVVVCVALLVPGASPLRFSKVQLLLVWLGLGLSNSLALRAVLGRYVHGQGHSFTQLGASPSWWWTTGLSPDAVWLIGTLAGFVALGAVCIWILRCEVIPGKHDPSKSSIDPGQSRFSAFV